MPNTLAHIALHSLTFHRVRVPFVIILLGCFIPDIPWILQRLYLGLGLGEESVRTVAYFTAQASLAVCLIACIALCTLFDRWKIAFPVLMAGCAVHLVLDALQDKWGNGVHLLAPFDWTLQSFPVVGTTTALITVISIAGLLPFVGFKRIRSDARSITFSRVRMTIGLVVALTYLLLPMLFIDAVIESNARYLSLLAAPETRTGELIELDREQLYADGEEYLITTPVGEDLRIASSPEPLVPGETSLRGYFVSSTALRVVEVRREHGHRDTLSIVGLSLILAWLFAVAVARVRMSPMTEEQRL